MNKKDFNEGMKGGIRLSEEIVKKDTKALEELKTEIGKLPSELKTIKDSFNVVNGKLENNQLKELYGVIKSFDYKKEFQQEEKIILIGLLVYLKNEFDETQNQKQFRNRLLAYLEVNPNDVINSTFTLSSIENLDSKKVLKAMYQITKEYLFLTSNSHDYDNYEDVLDVFGLREKESEAVEALINVKIKAFGLSVLWEQFGGEVEIPDEVKKSDFNAPKEQICLKDILHISAGEEKIFKNKSIIFMNFVNVEGSLIFENCNLVFDDKDFTESPIVLNSSSHLTIKDSNISCKINVADLHKGVFSSSEDDEVQKYFIDIKYDGNRSNEVDGVTIEIDGCNFDECSYFFRHRSSYSEKTSSIKFTGCNIINCHKIAMFGYYCKDTCEFIGTYIENNKRISFQKLESSYIIQAPNEMKIKMTGCKVKSMFNADKMFQLVIENYEKLDSGAIEAESLYSTNIFFAECPIESIDSEFYDCYFKDMDNSFSLIKNGSFHNCFDFIHIGLETSEGLVENVTFENCELDFDGKKKFLNVKNCTFKNSKVFFGYTCFSNCKFEYEEIQIKGEGSGYGLRMDYGVGRNNKFSYCTFENIHMLESYYFDADWGRCSLEMDIAEFDSCTFRNCTTKRADGHLIRTQRHYEEKGWLGNKYKPYTAINLKNCTGLK